ncbi:IPT/TIG domain-containing protein [Hymenobacter crusticola]|uniref:IPT/TIG domain-containing protein n=1 Tax=Hymenobacter crusticola TaxID=1770526 RepID=A0A243W830_9BACT|nr:IPT/TIG domain-containing protein [Hymenobacter crusticola]OUJ70019.1 hypothetical protein BXP70_25440 [Hymenobacter crusticola]
MNNTFAIGSLLLLVFFATSCESENEAPRLLQVTSITPGTTLLGGSSLNTAMIGDTLTIRGEGFSSVAADNQVTVQGIATPVLTASATQLQATVPTGVPYSYVQVIVRREGYPPAEKQISIRSTPSPVITGIRPTQGRVGSLVTIYGHHLLETVEANQVAFADANGQAAAVFVRPFTPLWAMADSLQIRVPAQAGTGRIALYVRPAQNVANTYFSITTPVFTVVP